MNYMVVECHDSYAVVLSEDGAFLKVANLHYQVGQQVTQIVEMKEPPKKFNTKVLYSIVSVAACFLIALTAFFGFANKAVGSVYVKINPQVRIDVNRNDTVVGLEGVNDDGISLIEDYSYKNKHLDTVVDELIDMAIAQKFLSEGKTITVAFDGKDQTWVSTHESHLTEHISTYLAQKLSVSVQIGEIADEIIEEVVDEVIEELEESPSHSVTVPNDTLNEMIDEELEEVIEDGPDSDDDFEPDDDDFEPDDDDDDFEPDDDDDFEPDDDDDFEPDDDDDDDEDDDDDDDEDEDEEDDD